ncbi:SepM family pheromone-processing serine protease [Planomicrobium sp. YIM 101495]|uniref:SepM family pheromone-processing serine protease n=1 Tax=Planomicrobium sp. YIM 101495 TaxID=2665160 RepID=UPI0012B709C5|nr:SepM family pheromone-processing serine protease [Planomicrobium sp. YIM 101495]MTD30344.1 PDZ domain-containing protein [Planomicrobium sp. YIM 101495]
MKGKKWTVLIGVTLIALFLSLYQMDSYITRPGSAYELAPFVSIEGSDKDDEGTLSLMTVSMLTATPALYVAASFMDGYEVLAPEQVRSPDESEDEYNVRQLKLMSDSQVNAVQVAFERAGKEFELIDNGVFVLNVLDGSAADGILNPGDRIIALDGEELHNQEAFVDYLASVGDGEAVDAQVEREGRTISHTIELAPLPTEPERSGLGITFVEDKRIETDPPVEIDSETIGGPSAGLMFTLEIMNQLLDEDLTKGYDVAGTGTMSGDGTVGRIGGIDQKVMAADRSGIDIFFAPDDETNGADSNYDVAKATAESIGTDMKIVPVKTIDDALDYLSGVSPK